MKLTKQNDPDDRRCACPGCRNNVNEDDWCHGCKFYVCGEHSENCDLPFGTHDVVEHWEHTT